MATPKKAPTAVATKAKAKANRNPEPEFEVPAGFDDVSSDFNRYPSWDFDNNPVLVGDVLRVDVANITDGKGTRETGVAHVVTDDGETVALWESAALADLFGVMKKGSRIHVIYTGTEELSRNRSLRKFRSYHRAP